MKRLILSTMIAFAMTASYIAAAQETSGSQNFQNRRQGERGNRMDRFRGGERGGFGRGRMMNPRAEVEKKLKEQFPKEYAEIQKLREEAEKKLQELAKKAKVELPALPKSMEERMAELKKKYPKEYAEYEELLKKDRRAAFGKLREIMRKNGDARMQAPGKEAPSRENAGRQLRELRKKYPEEWKKIREMQRKDPAKARQMTKDLLEKSKKESEK